MQTITTIGFDIAKSVFQVHGVGAGGQVLIRRQLKRLLVARVAGTWPYRAADATRLRKVTTHSEHVCLLG
jgi:transposase